MQYLHLSFAALAAILQGFADKAVRTDIDPILQS
jgi:hypothetical protein